MGAIISILLAIICMAYVSPCFALPAISDKNGIEDSSTWSNATKLGKQFSVSANVQDSRVSGIIETLVVVDKDLADSFQQNRVKILDYLTVWFWDMNLRYKTLPSVDLSFRVTDYWVAETTVAQPFIENVRGPDGKAGLGDILQNFGDWVYSNQAHFKKFDIAILLTKTNVDNRGGVAWPRSACQNKGSAVIWDDGNWGSTTTGAHEIAHIFGAADEDYPCPGYPIGYIMTGGTTYKWFFSPCSDRDISGFVRSEQAACLKRIDEGSMNPISADFSFLFTPPMIDQCKRIVSPDAYIEEKDTGDCRNMRCMTNGGGAVMAETPENSPCKNENSEQGRCFRGRCLKPGILIQNVGTGMCLRAPNPFAVTVELDVVDCPQYVTPLDRFMISDGNFGKMLCSPWNSVDAKINTDRCIYTDTADGNNIWTAERLPNHNWGGWDLPDLGNGEFFISHRLSKKCAKQVGNGVKSFVACNANDRNMRWRKIG